MIWRRLDAPGHEVALLRTTPGGAEIRGMAVFADDAEAALAYEVRCDARWLTTAGSVRGWHGATQVALDFARDADGRWTMNGAPCEAVAGCPDLDLNFTPATNLLPLRRLALAVGERAEVRSAWLEWPARRLRPMVQRYHRRTALTYDYEADLPDGERFAGELEVDAEGWVRRYAGLWVEER